MRCCIAVACLLLQVDSGIDSMGDGMASQRTLNKVLLLACYVSLRAVPLFTSEELLCCS